MILVDSSARIAFLRKDGTPAHQQLRSLNLSREAIVVADLVLLEVLRGVRDERAARTVEADPRRFTFVEVGGRQAAVEAADIYRRLRALGITIRSSMDLLIGACCVREGYVLLHQDRRDFAPMQEHLGLRCL